MVSCCECGFDRANRWHWQMHEWMERQRCPFRFGCRNDACSALHTLAEQQHKRAIEAIDFKTRVSLLDAPHLDLDFCYLDASMAAVYLHNRLVGSNGKTPYEFVKKSQPMITHLMPFGVQG